MENKSTKPAPKEDLLSNPCDPEPETPPADSQKVAFSLGSSEEADLDSNDMDTKDIDISNGEIYIP